MDRDCSSTEHLLRMAAPVHPSDDGPPRRGPPTSYRWFPSLRMLTSCLLCLCFASVNMMNSNMGMAIVCMVNSTEYEDTYDSKRNLTSDKSGEDETSDLLILGEAHMATGGGGYGSNVYNPHAAPRLAWTPKQQGYVFSAFNVGLLFMLATGYLADKLNAKYMIMASVLLACTANLVIPILSPYSYYWAILGRFMVGLADSLLQPAVNSLITRWFPHSERSYALGMATGGRQLGGLLIIPAAGTLCGQTALFGGWPAIFYLSAFVGLCFIIIFTILGADKPSKHSCISDAETKFIAAANAGEDCGAKRNTRKAPWKRILSSGAVWASVVAVLCHEYPLITMIMFLPSYLHDVYHYSATQNGLMSALPMLALWMAKLSSSWFNTWLLKHTKWRRTTICKILNGVGSAILGIFLFATTLLDSSKAFLGVVFLSVSMAGAGLHTPGCQASLVSVAPAFSGIITGLCFFFVACAGIANPLITKWIVKTGTAAEWNLVFYISTVAAILPCVTFTLWGSADVQWWARTDGKKPSKEEPKKLQAIDVVA